MKTRILMKKTIKNKIYFIAITVIVSLLFAIFTSSMVFFFGTRGFPAHDWIFIKTNFWKDFVISLLGGLPMAFIILEKYDNTEK